MKNHWNATLRRKDMADRGSGRGGQAGSTCSVLKDYMVRISLLPGGSAAPPPRAPAAASGVVDAPQLAPAASHRGGADLRTATTSSAAAAPLVAASATAEPPSYAPARPSASKRPLHLPAHLDAQAAPSASPSSSTSTQAMADGRSAALADGGVGASEGTSRHAAGSPQGVVKRPRIITFAAIPTSSPSMPSRFVVDPHTAASRGSAFAPPAALGPYGQAQASAAVAVAMLPPRPAAAAAPAAATDAHHTGSSLQLQFRGHRLRHRSQQQQHPDDVPSWNWASDSAEESLYGSPVSERVCDTMPGADGSAGEEDEELQPACGGRQQHQQMPGHVRKPPGSGQVRLEPAASSEMQAAQIMLALKSLS